MPKDYYLVLGINRGANLSKIKKAYRTVIKRYHPDITQSKETTQRFLEIREAYETLSDEARRRTYDEELFRGGSGLKIARAPEPIETRRAPFDEAESSLYAFTDDFFGGLIHGLFDVDKGRLHSKDLFFEAILTPMEAKEGGLFPLSVPVAVPCPRCSKTGLWEDLFCPVCSGSGRITSEKRFSLSIPPGVENGTQIRLSLEDIGLRGAFLNIWVTIAPGLDEWGW